MSARRGTRGRRAIAKLTIGAALALAVTLAVALAARARGAAPSSRADVIVHLPAGTALAPEALRIEPPGRVSALRVGADGTLQLASDGTPVTLRIPGCCPLSIPPRGPGADHVAAAAVPLFHVERTLAQVGYDAPFTVRVVPGCPEAAGGEVRWRQIEGEALAELAIEERGFLVRARTLPLSAFLAAPLPHGVVAVSPRTQGRSVLEATAAAAGSPPQTLRVTVTSIARATGTSSLAVSQRIMLGGEGWHITRAPPFGHAGIELRDGVATFMPDVAGRYLLADGDGRSLELQALTHDRTPLDCARRECHAAISTAVTQTPMSAALSRPFASAEKRSDATCALECHVVGEPGLRDGGFLDVAAALGFRPSTTTPAAELPHALQRLGGVRCTSCHGPSAIPPPEGAPVFCARRCARPATTRRRPTCT